ncbi:MAG: sulfate adenylyltransferase, partial [Blastocatellia bacterium]
MINRKVAGEKREALLQAAPKLARLRLNAREVADLELIANGAFSPLEGFLGEADYVSVRDHRRLAGGLVWTIPVTLSTTKDERKKLKIGEDVALHGR